jgi:molecular chaperone GrpE
MRAWMETAMTEQDTAPPPDGAGAPGPDAADALAQAQATAQENWNKYLRAVAELDNVRKRTARDVEQARRFGVERLAGELLAAVDSLEMGLEAATGASVESLLEGKRATLRLLRAALEKAGVSEIAPAGQAFDPQLHEALGMQPAPAAEPGSVIAVVQKGYQLNGRLLRPARVIVAAAAEAAAPPTDDVPAGGGA